MEKEVYIYNGKEFSGLKEIIDHGLEMFKSKDQFRDYLTWVKNLGPYALQNIGYMSGYYKEDTMLKIQEIFETAHPVFGRTVPTSEEALTMGEKIGKSLKGESVNN